MKVATDFKDTSLSQKSGIPLPPTASATDPSAMKVRKRDGSLESVDIIKITKNTKICSWNVIFLA